jgi:parA family protein
MKSISVFNNKGGVGKSTLTYHLGNAMAELGHKVLLIDLDPQCNLTLFAMKDEELHRIWEDEDKFIEDYENAAKENPKITSTTRSIHFILKPAEDGMNELPELPPPYHVADKIDLIPGRLSLHRYENKIAERWSGVYLGDNLSIRTVTNIRTICNRYAEVFHYDYILIDTSPSLGILNKVIISTVDGFFIPVQPDMFSLYGIKNIGNSLNLWKREFDAIYSLISSDKRAKFPQKLVQFLGFTIYNAKKYSTTENNNNPYNLAQAHLQYVSQIPPMILHCIQKGNREEFTDEEISTPIGKGSIIHSHNTYPAMAQALKCPIWKIPEAWRSKSEDEPDYIESLQNNGFSYNKGNNGIVREIQERYKRFTQDLLSRIDRL